MTIQEQWTKETTDSLLCEVQDEQTKPDRLREIAVASLKKIAADSAVKTPTPLPAYPRVALVLLAIGLALAFGAAMTNVIPWIMGWWCVAIMIVMVVIVLRELWKTDTKLP